MLPYMTTFLSFLKASSPMTQRDMIRECIFKDSVAETFNQIYSSTSTLSCNTVDELVDNFHSKISDIIDSIAPIKVKEVLHQSEVKKGSVEKLNADGERLDSRFTIKSIKRDSTDITYN
ncbi:hypothetical protein ATANTOWER_028017 [Ataeniobius toweri]|uniref:Uncharacterized protein n=1 Tax=Ataeniobius toweri TaxID=208326 RepID=A0ABU7BTV7_9TELE|nr:hypothetical protein [Ataeniobius toweri]